MVEIINNKIINNVYEGISISKGWGHIVSGNTISNNGWKYQSEFSCGIMLQGPGSKTTVSNNIISYNKPTGIYFSLQPGLSHKGKSQFIRNEY